LWTLNPWTMFSRTQGHDAVFNIKFREIVYSPFRMSPPGPVLDALLQEKMGLEGVLGGLRLTVEIHSFPLFIPPHGTKEKRILNNRLLDKSEGCLYQGAASRWISVFLADKITRDAGSYRVGPQT